MRVRWMHCGPRHPHGTRSGPGDPAALESALRTIATHVEYRRARGVLEVHLPAGTEVDAIWSVARTAGVELIGLEDDSWSFEDAFLAQLEGRHVQG